MNTYLALVEWVRVLELRGDARAADMRDAMARVWKDLTAEERAAVDGVAAAAE